MEENHLKKEVDNLVLDGISLVRDLKSSCDAVPDKTGIYVVLGNYGEMPEFLEKGTGPEFNVKKGIPHPMNYPLHKLQKKWIDDTWIMYIGKSDDSLYERISTYIKFGLGHDVAHRGGRAIWQLPDQDNLLIGWKVIEGTGLAGKKEKELLETFKKNHSDRLPFANWRK